MIRVLDELATWMARRRGFSVSRGPGSMTLEQDRELAEAEQLNRELGERLRRVRLYEVMRANMQRGPEDGSK